MKRARVLALLAIGFTSGCVPDSGRPDLSAEIYHRILDAEDARPRAGDPALATLLDAAALEDVHLRRIAVRALGRLESPVHAATISRYLADPSPEVRAAAADALAQSVHRGDGSDVAGALLQRVPRETDAGVRGMLARSLGRLSLNGVLSQEVEDALVALGAGSSAAPEQTLIGVALGFESLTRRAPGGGLTRPSADLLTEMMAYRGDERSGDGGATAGHIRALAASALGRSRRLSSELIQRALDDPESEVRRVAVGFLGAAPPTAREALLRRALADPSVRVSTEAVRFLAAAPRTEPRCEQLLAVAGAAGPPARRLPALAALAQPCPVFGPQRTLLISSAQEVGDPGSPWQPAAQALLSLTLVDREAATRLLPTFVSHDNPFVRTYAARGAARLRDASALFSLAVDPSPNVRTEAVQGLFEIDGHGLDDFLLEQLEGDDPQLLMTVSGLLKGAPERARVASDVLTAFERISRAERETWRDVRLALMERIGELGDESLSQRLIPFLRDYDPLVAEATVGVLETWTGGEYLSEPRPLRRTPVPELAELRELEGSVLTLHMRGGGSMMIELHADQATTNVARVARLARAGYYDGLTFHRWAANFVIQGGSPGANEYQGDGPYTRDEVGGMPHWRGTVGISTRGRDTGDGQIFINLVDNPRLDYDYTVIGRLIGGEDVLDAVLEGALIERAEVVSGR